MSYVICIRPNGNKLPTKFNDYDVAKQLQAVAGESLLRMKNQGFPVRINFSKFIERLARLIEL